MEVFKFNSNFRNIEPAGDLIRLRTRSDRHMGPKPPDIQGDRVLESFGSMLNKALDTVNHQQVHAEKLAEKMVYDPSSVDAHTMTIAAEKARMSLTFVRTMVEETVRAYRELTNIR